MDLIFGEATYTEGRKNCKGKVILTEHKLFLRGQEGDLAQTFIPLEKIERLKLSGKIMEIQVRPAMAMQYLAVMQGGKANLKALAEELVKRRGFKKRFLKSEWVETPK